MKVSLYIILISILLSKYYALSHIIRKRQLFREQVLPHTGGKIPDSAFMTDRLALNRLQKDGIAVPDGVLLEQRKYQVYPHQYRSTRPTFRVVHTPDYRYISPEGKYNHDVLATVDTTYLIPNAGDTLMLHDHLHNRRPHYPPKETILNKLRLPNYAVFNFDYRQEKRPIETPIATQSSPLHPTFDHHSITSQLPQGLPQEFVSYHAAVDDGHKYTSVHTYDIDFGSHGTAGSWNDGSIPSSVVAYRKSFSSQPIGSFEGYYSKLNVKHHFHRNVAEPTPALLFGNTVTSTPKLRDGKRSHLERQRAQIDFLGSEAF